MNSSMSVFLRRLLAVPAACLILASSATAAIIHTEDFEDDNIAGAPGFASAIFQHNIVGPNAFITAPFFLPPSPRHALFQGAATTDTVTFALNPGETVESAGVWMTGTGGGLAGVTFVGSLGFLNFSTAVQDSFQHYFVDPSNGIGDIVAIVLGDVPPIAGQEALYDDIQIRVIPEPSAGLLVVFGVLSLVSARRSRPVTTA